MKQLSVQNLSFSYSDKKILDNISINISKGEFVTLAEKLVVAKLHFYDF